jgi:carbon-monoxide dehydrogenase small subunit
MDGLPVNACLVPAYQARGCDILTAESTAPEEAQCLLESGATQCGACTPGVVMMTRWIASQPRVVRDRDARELFAGNLCRCTGYAGILRGIDAALGRDGEE